MLYFPFETLHFSDDTIYPHPESPTHHHLQVARWPLCPNSPLKRPAEEDRPEPRKKRIHPATFKFLTRQVFFDK